MFKVGDKVMYIGSHPEHRNRSRVYTIKRVCPHQSFTGRGYCHVKEDPSFAPRFANLVHFSLENE